MLTPIIPPIQSKVAKTQVSAKDPHHEINQEKEEKERQEKKERQNEPQDIIELSEDKVEEAVPKKKYPDSPMQGHIDINV